MSQFSVVTRPLPRRTLLTDAGALALSAVALSACSGQQPAGPASQAAGGAPRRGGVLTFAANASSATEKLDPQLAKGPSSYFRNVSVFDTLTATDADGWRLESRLAELWEPSVDLTQWRFTLRQGATFHDGRPLEAKDVIWTFRRILDKELGSGSFSRLSRTMTPEGLIARSFDLLLTVPPLITVLVLIVSIGTSVPVLILAVGLVLVPWVGRVARGAAQAVVTNDYVHAAVARGERTRWILRREVLPTVATPLISAFGLYLTSAIVLVSTLSFLGLGDQPPSSSWGLMAAESRGFIATNPWATLAPALGIAAISVSFMLIADAITRHVGRHSGPDAMTGAAQ